MATSAIVRSFVSVNPTSENHMSGLELARSIKRICDLTDTRLSRFGRDAVGDPRFYYDLIGRTKREPRPATRLRALAHAHKLAIEHHRASAACSSNDRIDGLASVSRSAHSDELSDRARGDKGQQGEATFPQVSPIAGEPALYHRSEGRA